jgi:hypothetical protein
VVRVGEQTGAGMSDLLTHSRLACFRACPRRHLYAYEYGLRPILDSEPLRVGKAFALAVETQATGGDVEAALEGQVKDPFEFALVAAMFTTHTSRWANESPEEHVAAELPFEIALRNPDTGASTPIWKLAGKIDRIVRLADGRLALKEYKTTSRDFAPGADYWLKLQLDSQLSIYLLAARELGYDVTTILYDVMRRPGLRPLKATPKEARKFTKDGALYKTQRDKDETPDEYAARCASTLVEDPVRSFARIEIARTDSDLEEARAEIWTEQLVIREAQRSGRWYRNPEACVSTTGVKCDFLSVCQFQDLATRTPQGFRRVENVHEELPASPKQVGYAREGQASQNERISNVR